jgi:REP-associated tyrosine transposase
MVPSRQLPLAFAATAPARPLAEERKHLRGRRRPGRKPSGPLARASHLRRPVHDHRHPLHVIVHLRQGLPTLRSQSMFDCVREQIRRASTRYQRIVHFSVQSNHIHLVVEANDRGRLAQGMKGFGVRVARHLNQLLGCRGTVWDDRYYARALASPREVRNVLVYVLGNRAKHGGMPGRDPCSSHAYFDGWMTDLETARARASPDDARARDRPASTSRTLDDDPPVSEPSTWLLAVGWKRLGLILDHERPVAARRR